MAPVLESATTASDGHAVVTVRGDIAADTAIELWQYLSHLVGQGHQHLVLDVGAWS
jgi:anti-anti-sigma regulatory factor